jgi:creatinine amidohydrolase
MRTTRFELLRPDEIIEERKRIPVVYFSLGPLEWHSRHLPFGTDPLHAEAVAHGAAKETGGVVLPTFYWGSEMERSRQMLKNIGFKGDEWIVGMDFPANSMPSLYIPEDAFSIAVRAYLKLLVAQGYKLIVIVNGHGGENHLRVLRNLANEFTATTGCKVICTLVAPSSGDEAENGKDNKKENEKNAEVVNKKDNENINEKINHKDEDAGGHATKNETSVISYLYPESVDLNVLPPPGKPIYNVNWAIVDGASFAGRPNEDFSVREDPREATQEEGREMIEEAIRNISRKVRALLKGM